MRSRRAGLRTGGASHATRTTRNRASTADRRLAGARTICMVPLSSGPRWLGSSVRARAAAIRAHGAAGWKQRDLLYMALPDWTGANQFGEVLRRTLAAQRHPYLAFAIRTDWARRPDQRRNIERCLAAPARGALPPAPRVLHTLGGVRDPRRRPDARDAPGSARHGSARGSERRPRPFVVLEQLDEVAVEVLDERDGDRPAVELGRRGDRLAAGRDGLLVERRQSSVST